MNEDLILIEEYKRGSVSAFETLYKKYASKMKGVAYRYVNDSFIAEDILQEAFVKIFNNLNTFESTGSFEAWIRRIVVNTSINYYNSIKKENEKLADYAFSSENNNTEELFEEDGYDVGELIKAINQLPPGYKIVFNLFVIDQYSHKEIAEKLKITEGTSKSQLFKSKDFIKKILLNKNVVQND